MNISNIREIYSIIVLEIKNWSNGENSFTYRAHNSDLPNRMNFYFLMAPIDRSMDE